MKINTVLFVVILFSSCHPYLDIGKSIQSNNMEFNYLKDYNKFIYKSNVNAIADTKVYYKTYFSINLPKKIINWKVIDNDFFFEYDNKQIIYIGLKFKGKDDVISKNDWKEVQLTNTEIWDLLYQYWRNRGYNENQLKMHDSRVSKIYTDGNATILFYNITSATYDKYVAAIKSFEYR